MAGTVREWVAGKTVWSPCYHGPCALAMGSSHNRALYKCPITLLTTYLLYFHISVTFVKFSGTLMSRVAGSIMPSPLPNAFRNWILKTSIWATLTWKALCAVNLACRCYLPVKSATHLTTLSWQWMTTVALPANCTTSFAMPADNGLRSVRLAPIDCASATTGTERTTSWTVSMLHLDVEFK